MEKGQKKNTIVVNSIIFLILLVGTIAILDEFFNIRDETNLVIISLTTASFVTFAWERVIKRILDKWF